MCILLDIDLNIKKPKTLYVKESIQESPYFG